MFAPLLCAGRRSGACASLLRLGFMQTASAIFTASTWLGGPLLKRLPFFQRHNLVAVDLKSLLAHLHQHRVLQRHNIHHRAFAVRSADLFVARG